MPTTPIAWILCISLGLAELTLLAILIYAFTHLVEHQDS
jgi:hypothetical protein